MNTLKIFDRKLNISIPTNPLHGSGAIFLMAPRQSGKTTYLKHTFAKAKIYDLLDTKLSARLSVHPSQLRSELLEEKPPLVIIDEIQIVPNLLDEVHWLLENTSTKFILSGSSARKLKRKSRNLLGGRAPSVQLFPFVTAEVPSFDLDRYLNYGGIPIHYLADSQQRTMLQAYVENYLKEEIIDEAATKNIPAFMRFLEIAAIMHGQQINYSNIASDCSVSSKTVKTYYSILTDTLLGFELKAWTKSTKRRMVETSKYYLFDIGIVHQLHPDIIDVSPGSSSYGRAFESFIFNEIRAYLHYQNTRQKISYWKTSSNLEVDLIIGNMDVAIEIKSSTQLRQKDFKGLRALKQEHNPNRTIIISRTDKKLRTQDNIEIIPWQDFCAALWNGNILKG